MKKNLALLLTTLMYISLCACGGEESQNATGQMLSINEEVNEADLSSSSFWLDRLENADEVIMTIEEINRQNELLLSTWGTDWTGGYYDVKSFPEKIDREWLEERICYLDLKNTKLYYKGESISEEQWEQYYSNLNLDAISEEITVSYAVINKNTSALDLPTEDIITDSDMNEEYNALQETTLKINEPIIVLHDSLDSEWVFAVANEFIGWVKKECCSYFFNRQEWLDYQEQEKFIIVTEDAGISEVEQKLLMGTKLFLSEQTIDDTVSEYTVIIPQADDNGFISFKEVKISNSSAVSVGYLPFTREKIIELAFQELGDPYGWGGMDGKRDCSSYMKDIYACFGFQLPRNSRLQQSMPKLAKDISSLSEEEKEKCVENASAGDIMGISGHIMMYLGKVGEKHYVISMLSSYVPEDVTENFENSVVSINQVVVNSLGVKRRNGNTWLQELKAIVSFQ